MGTDQGFIAEVRRIVLDALKDQPARVYFFGSRAWGTEYRYSDVDVAVDGPVPAGVWLDLEQRLEESWVPYTVDLVDLSQAPAKLRERVLAEGIRWNG